MLLVIAYEYSAIAIRHRHGQICCCCCACAAAAGGVCPSNVADEMMKKNRAETDRIEPKPNRIDPKPIESSQNRI